MNDVSRTVRVNRFKLVLVASIFVLPMMAAGVLTALNWHPGTQSHGKPILPQRSFKDIRIVMDDGGDWPWRDSSEPRMTLVALSTGACGEACIKTLTLLRNARITLNEKQDRVRLLHLGQPAVGKAGEVLARSWRHGRDVDGVLAGFRPQRSGVVAAVLVESNGTALVQYPAGFSPDGFKKDLHKVIH